MLKGRLDGSYISRNGNRVFRYVVTGSQEELVAYEEALGENLRHNDKGQPLYFTTDGSNGSEIQLGISQDGKIYVDTTEVDMLAAIAEKHGIASEVIAKMIVEKLVSKTGARPTSSSAQVEAKEENELGEM